MSEDLVTILGTLSPPGVESRTPEENEAYRQQLLVSFITLPLISGLVIGLRMYAKLKIARNLWVDDMATMAAYVRLVSLTYFTVLIGLI